MLRYAGLFLLFALIPLVCWFFFIRGMPQTTPAENERSPKAIALGINPTAPTMRITLEELEAKLEPYWSESPVSRTVDTGPGWYDLIADLVDDLVVIAPNLKVAQIKEKFGGLRFYIDSIYGNEEADAVYNRIRNAERLSEITCETCGGPGTLRKTGWHRTLCDEHAKEK